MKIALRAIGESCPPTSMMMKSWWMRAMRSFSSSSFSFCWPARSARGPGSFTPNSRSLSCLAQSAWCSVNCRRSTSSAATLSPGIAQRDAGVEGAGRFAHPALFIGKNDNVPALATDRIFHPGGRFLHLLGNAGALSKAGSAAGESGAGGHSAGPGASGAGKCQPLGFRRNRRAKNPNGHYLRSSGDGEKRACFQGVRLVGYPASFSLNPI
jgi:hypothetical protein